MQERILNTRSDYDFAGESELTRRDGEKLVEIFKSSGVEEKVGLSLLPLHRLSSST